jgi:hypothetical protein
MKTPVLWKPKDTLERACVCIQRHWRGWLLRQWMKLAGPGVLRRSVCHNEEDVGTCVEKDKQHPLEYFGVEEDGKVWWFDIRTILRWSIEHVERVNPYTRRPLSNDACKRLHGMYALRIHMGHPCAPVFTTVQEIIRVRSIRIVQYISDYVYTELPADDLIDLSLLQLCSFSQSIVHELQTLYVTTRNERVRKYIYWMESCFRTHVDYVLDPLLLKKAVYGTILAIYMDTPDPFPYCFACAKFFYAM